MGQRERAVFVAAGTPYGGLFLYAVSHLWFFERRRPHGLVDLIGISGTNLKGARAKKSPRAKSSQGGNFWRTSPWDKSLRANQTRSPGKRLLPSRKLRRVPVRGCSCQIARTKNEEGTPFC
jgi:hypothetical protein